MAGSNASVFSFKGTNCTATHAITSITANSSGAEIDVTHLASERKEYEVGLPDWEISIEFNLEPTTIEFGEIGTVEITFGTGPGSESIAIDNCVCTGVDRSGSVDSAVARGATFKPGRSTGATS